MRIVVFSFLVLFLASCSSDEEVFSCSPVACPGQSLNTDEIRFILFDVNDTLMSLDRITQDEFPYLTNDSIAVININNDSRLNTGIFPAIDQNQNAQLRLFLSNLDISLPDYEFRTPYGEAKQIRFNIEKEENGCECYKFDWDNSLIVDGDTIYPEAALTYHIKF